MWLWNLVLWFGAIICYVCAIIQSPFMIEEVLDQERNLCFPPSPLASLIQQQQGKGRRNIQSTHLHSYIPQSYRESLALAAKSSVLLFFMF